MFKYPAFTDKENTPCQNILIKAPKFLSFDSEKGEENIEERLSDLYSTRNNVSLRAPKILSRLAEKGVTQSRNFDGSTYVTADNYTQQEGSDFGSLLTFRNDKFKKEIDQRVYYTEYERNKENFEPQTTYQSINISEYSLNFGPKASNMVSFYLSYC